MKKSELVKIIKECRKELLRETAGEEAKKKGLIHLGFGYYGKKKGEAEFKSDGDKLRPLSDKEKQQSKEKTSGEKKPAAKQTPKKAPRKVKMVDKDGPEYKNPGLDKLAADKKSSSGMKKDEYGNDVTTDENGELHSHNDEPAFIKRDHGSKVWYNHGKIHRDGDKPAYISPDGIKMWFKDGKKHRDEDRPAYIGKDGEKEWWQHGSWHRDGDKPAMVFADGEQRWYKNGGLYTRSGGKPNVIKGDGTKMWYKWDRKYKVEKPDGTVEYYKKGKVVKTEKPGKKGEK
jgi:hypothetical protein